MMTLAENKAAALRHLSHSALFESLPEDDLKGIVARMRPVKYDAGRLIFSRGDPGNGIYLVLSGVVRLSILAVNGREISLNIASEGVMFGEIAALDKGERSADATAISATETMVLPETEFMALVTHNPRIAEAVIRFLCHRLRENARKLETVALCAVDVRLARFYLTLIEERSPGLVSGHVSVPITVSQSEVALLIGASRPKVNSAFTFLAERGAFKRRGATLDCNVDVLRQCAAYKF